MTPRLTVIVASCGRPTLARTLDSVKPQLHRGDEVLVSVNNDCPWGHAARNQLMLVARGNTLLFMDDDDVYLPGALSAVRAAVAAEPDRLHIFRMRYASGGELWTWPQVMQGNVSTQMIAVPNRPADLGTWGTRYEGDLDFISSTKMGEPVWHEDVIALIRPVD